MKSVIYTLALLLVLTFPARETKAQVITGYSDLFTFDTRLTDVQGVVVDSENGNVIPGAMVTLTGQGNSYTATSQISGSYSLGAVPAGNYILSVFKLGFEEYEQNVTIDGQPVQILNVSMTPGGNPSIEINDLLFALADNIVEGPTDVFTLSGNVHINNVLFFDGNVMIDKRSSLSYPEIRGSCGFFARNIASNPTYWIKQNNIAFSYAVQGERLVPQEWADLLTGSFMLGGFSVTIGEIIVDPDFDFVEVKCIAEMPFPINKVKEYLANLYETDLPLYVEKMSGSRILSKTSGVETIVDISGLSVNIGLVSLVDVNLYFDTYTQTYGGGFTLLIPGSEGGDMPLEDSETGGIPVEILNEHEQVVDSMSFHEFVEMNRAGGFALVSFGAQIEFVEGGINKLVISIGTRVPLGSSGLFLTQVTGGGDDLATEKWKVFANVDIELGYEVPGLGSPVKLNDFGVLIQPWETFRGGGQFQIFDQTVSDGYIEYNRPMSSLTAECNLNLSGILKGRTYLGLVGGQVNGSGMFSINTPPKSSLPWFLRWAGNQKIGGAYAEINNKYFQSSVQYYFIKFAQKLEFGKTGFPWFHYYLGRNMNSLHKIWKGEIDGMQAITFMVPENARQLLVVAMDTINPTSFDFTLQGPSGQLFNQENAYYYEANDEDKQTIMSLLKPMAGEWNFLAGYEGQFAVEVSIANQESAMLASMPLNKRTRSNQISLDICDYADTMQVQVYYNTSRRNFNGTLISDFRVINNGSLDFTWQNQDVPNGEYFIYCRVDDGYNEPYLQYAPGSIWVENTAVIESPENFTVEQVNNTFQAHWDEPASGSIIAAIVYYKNISTGRILDETVYQETSVILADLEPGQEYQVWACFIDSKGVFGEPSEKTNLIFTSSQKNNPPYFTLDPDSMFVYVEGQQSIYKLTANDADGDALNFNIHNDTLGMSMFGQHLVWTPSEGHRGVYDLMITVTDGSASDTTYQQLVVFTEQQVSVGLSFHSVKLYEDDNMFVRINHRFCPDFYQQVSLRNTRTQEETIIEARRVNDFEYLGKFSLSFIDRSDISVRNGDTIEAKYVYMDEEYLAYAYYDSLSQPTDVAAPGVIRDLRIEILPDDLIQLKWTATGNDADTGKAYLYDIRYAYEPINSEDVYFTAYRIAVFPYPSPAGKQDSLHIHLMELQDITLHDKIYFSIKAEDEMQNRSALGNSPGIEYNPGNVADPSMNGLVYKLYPNPTDGIFSLEFPESGLPPDIRVEICDLMGKRVMLKDLTGKYHYEIDLSGAPAGIYMVKVVQAGETGNVMLIRR
jgi:hypothetical protein